MKRSETRRLDKEWSLIVRTRDGFKCQVCGSVKHNNNAHHILPKTITEFRHELNNGICLCAYCHHWNKYLAPHQNALGWIRWLHKNKLNTYQYILEKQKCLEN